MKTGNPARRTRSNLENRYGEFGGMKFGERVRNERSVSICISPFLDQINPNLIILLTNAYLIIKRRRSSMDEQLISTIFRLSLFFSSSLALLISLYSLARTLNGSPTSLPRQS